MKYKNIHSALHNYAHSFNSGINYFDDTHIIEIIHDEVMKTPKRQLTIDLTTGTINPQCNYGQALLQSASWYAQNFRSHLIKHDIDPATIINPTIIIYADLKGTRIQIEAEDDRDNEYAIEPKATK